MSRPIFALVDGNSFYASCQQAFNPKLWGRPVVVLSNNDGCVVAANSQAKALNSELIQQVGDLGAGGYRSAKPSHMMFQPYFKVKWLLDKYQVAVFSSNYELYGDMSQRMHSIVKQFGRRQEVYSIDESFIDLTSMSDDLTAYGEQIRNRVFQWIHIPVAVGIGYSKTQAKLANHLAKKHFTNNVADLTSLSEVALRGFYAKTRVGDIWGVGQKIAKKLESQGINTALQLVEMDLQLARKGYSVSLERIIRELRGEACLPFEVKYADKQQIISSRSFGVPVSEYVFMEQAVVSYVCTAATKLRKQGSVCKRVAVSIRTSPFKTDSVKYSAAEKGSLIYPTDSSILLVKMAKHLLKQIWREGLLYQKASVALSAITEKESLQLDLFAQNPRYSGNKKSDALMKVTDQLNQVMGKNTLFLASGGIKEKQAWAMKRQKMSSRFTTRWGELLVVRAD